MPNAPLLSDRTSDDDFARLIDEIRACRLCAAELPLGPRPIVRGRPEARLLIISQAPGTRVHETGLSFDDRSGDRLRLWLGLDRETERAMQLDSPFDLMGLYRGVALPQKSVSDPQPGIDAIFLYRRPILDYWCETGEDLADIVRHIVIHEIGHHFGFSDEDMERIEQED